MNRKILAAFMPILLIGGMASAVWWQNWTDVGAVSVTSNRPVEFVVTASFSDVDVMDGPASTEQILEIDNRKTGSLDYIYSELVTITELEPVDCPDTTGDITVTTTFNSVAIGDGDPVTMNSGLNELNITVDALENSCPVDIEIDASLDVV